jgi:hypothetical protein
VTSSIRPTRNPALANARIAACAPDPGVLAPAPPGARTFMWIAVIPLSLAIVAACAAARIVAYADDSSLSDLTCIPPDDLAIVSAPEMSVKWIIVLLYELKTWTTAHLSVFLLMASFLLV